MAGTPSKAITIRGRSALVTLAAPWRRLQDMTNAAPTAGLEWVQAYFDTLGLATCDALQVVAVEDQSGVVAIAPMLRSKRSGVEILESIGVRETNEPADLLHKDADALRALFRALLRPRLPIVLPRLPLGGLTLGILRDTMRHRGVVVTRPGAATPSVVLGNTPDALLNAGRRSDLRRASRKAEKFGAMSTQLLSPSPGELPPLLDVALKIEAAGWKGRNGSALLCGHPNLDFFRKFLTLAAENKTLRLALLHIRGEPAAMQLAVEYGSCLWLLKIGYGERFAACSPGSLLMWRVLVDAAQRGLQRCEFLGNAEPWTKLWTNLECPCASVHAFPIGYASAVYLARRGMQRLRAMRGALVSA